MELSPLKIDREPRKYPTRGGGGSGRARKLPIGWAVLAVAVVGAGWVFWVPMGEFADRFRLVEVRTTTVEKSSLAAAGAVSGTAANGYVVASRRAALSADTPGRVVEMLVTEGAVVKEGQVVARLFADEYRAALRRAEADLGVARASAERAASLVEQAAAELSRASDGVAAARARGESAAAGLALARAELDRATELLTRHVGTQRELDQAREAFDRAEANGRATAAELEAAESGVVGAAANKRVAESAVAVAAAQVEAAVAARDLARATLDKTEVRAPFDGIVVLKDAEVGEVVSPNSQGGSNARGAICTMVDFASLEVQVEVPETNLQAVQLGGPASIFLDAYPTEPYAGRVDRIWPTANRQKASIEVRVAFETRDERLRPEMGVRVVFTPEGEEAPAAGDGAAAEASPRLLVPENVILRIEGVDGVFMLERDRVRFVPVKLGARGSGRVVVEEGVSEGDLLVIEPSPRLQDGDRVRVARD